MVWIVRKVSTAKNERYYLRRDDGVRVTAVLYFRGQGGRGISGTAGTSGMRDEPPGLWTFRFCCWRSRCSCSACIVARICSCCAIKSDVFGLEGRLQCKYRNRVDRTYRIRRMRMMVSPPPTSFSSFFSLLRSLMVPRFRCE